MIDILKGKSLSLLEIKEKRKVAAFYIDNDKETQFLDEAETQRLFNYVKEFLHGKASSGEELKNQVVTGYSANKGVVRGIARIVLSSKEFYKVNKGDILVTTMTSVDFVPIMEKAAAFVTNEGGITSHASIVAREMDKPCIIGTKIATKVLKDGDLIEVDANNGIVKIINK